MRHFLLFCILLLSSFTTSYSQSVTGLVYADEQALDGYVLFENGQGTYLINNCGEVINHWSTVWNTRLHSKLLPNGNLVFIKNNSVIEYDWDGHIVRVTSPNDLDIELDYEVIVLPNGNYLCLGRHAFSEEDFLNIGFNLNGQSRPEVVDVVVEMIPESGVIVWEWNIADHLIQFRQPDAPNYGDPSAHPELLNMDMLSVYDWTFYESFMINGMDYNPELDQIALSVRKLSEVIIIDHSTTTEEAAGSTGGNSGMGGDIIYRWGNPQNYGEGTPEDRQLYFQHNPNWITSGEWAGALMIYNNGLNRPAVSGELAFSSVVVIEPPLLANGNYELEAGEAYLPAAPLHQFGGEDRGPYFYSGYTSGAKVLPDGNTLITVGQDGRLLEVLPDGSIAWEYFVPNHGYIFRAEKYAADYPAFSERTLTPQGLVPGTNSAYECDVVHTETPETEQSFSAYYDAYRHQLQLHQSATKALVYTCYNSRGQWCFQGKIASGQQSLPLPELSGGAYFMQLQDRDTGQYQTIKLMVH